MGWDTQVIIIVEKINSVDSAKEIGSQIFEKDSINYEKESFYIMK